MTILFTDNFAATLSATNWLDEAAAPVWSTTGGLLACSTSSLRVLKTTTSAHAALIDVKASAKRASGTNFDGCLVVRCTITDPTSTTGSGYFMNWFDANTIQIFRRVTNTNSQIGLDITATHVNGSRLSLEATGSGATVTLNAYVDDVLVGTRTDSSGPRIVTGGQCGFFVFNNTSRFDDFEVDDLIVIGGGQPTSSRRNGVPGTRLGGQTFGRGW